MNGAEISIWAVFIVLGALQGFLLSAVLLARGRRNRMLAILLLVIALHLSEYALAITGVVLHFPHLTALSYPLLFLVGPLYYFYCRDLTIGVKLRLKDTLHAIPAVIALLLLLPFYLQIAEEKRAFLIALSADGNVEIPVGQFIFMVAQGIQTLVYLVMARGLVRKASKAFKQVTAGLEIATLGWLKNATSTLILYFVLFLMVIAILVAVDEHRVEIDYVLVLLLALLVYAVAFAVLRFPSLFEGADVQQQGRAQILLSKEEHEMIAAELQTYLAKERPYLSESLRLSEVAERLAVPPHQLSEVINVALGNNFFDLINSYRVEEAKRLLADPALRDRKVVAIAFDSGFGNKATFNRAFKKHTGTTPSAFRRQHQHSS